MDIKERKKQYKESPEHLEWFNSIEIAFSAYPCDYHQKFIGIERFYRFLEKEIQHFSTILKETEVPVLVKSKSQLLELQTNLNTHLDEIIVAHAERRSTIWNRFVQRINNIQHSIYIANCPEADFLINLFKFNPAAVEGAHLFFTHDMHSSRWINNRELFTGVIAAYEFSHSEFSQISNRRKSEAKSFQQLRSEFNDQIFVALKETEDQISALNKLNSAFEADIKSMTSKKSEDFDIWFNEREIESNELHHKARKQIIDLESTYKDKLMLKQPAEYWKERAKELKISANKWMIFAGASSLVGIIMLTILGYSLSLDKIGQHIKHPAISIRWSILSIIGIALIVFMIRTFVKLAMSSYHLSRDAEERKQLTYLYLSLKNETEIPDADRHIILQSLFSRSDTGLLKEDSSPTMPTSILDRINTKV